MLSESQIWWEIMFPGDFPTLANLIFGASNPLALLFDDSSSSNDSSDDSQEYMLINLLMINLSIRWRVSGRHRVVWLTSTMVTCWGTMPVHHEILRRIAITSRMHHMIFYWLMSLGWLKRRSMSCLYSCSHTCEIIGWATMTFVHNPKDIVYFWY